MKEIVEKKRRRENHKIGETIHLLSTLVNPDFDPDCDPKINTIRQHISTMLQDFRDKSSENKDRVCTVIIKKLERINIATRTHLTIILGEIMVNEYSCDSCKNIMYESYIENTEDSFELHKFGRYLIKIKDFQTAERVFHKIQNIAPQDPLAQGKIILCMTCQGKMMPKNKILQLANNTNDSSLLMHLGVMLAQFDREAAITIFYKSLENNPTHVLTLIHLGNCFIMQKNMTEAVTTFRRALEEDPYNLTALTSLGICLPCDESLLHYRAVLKRYPNDANILALLAEALLIQSNNTPSNTTEALTLLQQALNQNPQNFNALAGMGVYFFHSGNFVEAEKMFHQVLTINKKDTNALLYVAKCLQAQRKQVQAIVMYRKVLKECPNNEDAIKGLEELQEITS